MKQYYVEIIFMISIVVWACTLNFSHLNKFQIVTLIFAGSFFVVFAIRLIKGLKKKKASE